MTSTTKDSLFVKEMAVALWGTATLQRRGVSGKECPTNRNSPKPPLTPSKLQVLRGNLISLLIHACAVCNH